jgi:hypothetical protein
MRSGYTVSPPADDLTSQWGVSRYSGSLYWRPVDYEDWVLIIPTKGDDTQPGQRLSLASLHIDPVDAGSTITITV